MSSKFRSAAFMFRYLRTVGARGCEADTRDDDSGYKVSTHENEGISSM
jgi:hypothetical protein